MSTSTITCQVYRLEKRDSQTNEFKQYTAIHVPGRTGSIAGVAIFGYGRIGANWQWSVKEGGDAAGAVQSQLWSKRGKGYEDVWSADMDLPWDWTANSAAVRNAGRPLSDMIETAYRNGETVVRSGTDVDDGSPRSPLADLVDQARSVVSKLASNPDEALRDYGALVGARDAARSDWDVIDGYMEALTAMLSVAKEGAA